MRLGYEYKGWVVESILKEIIKINKYILLKFFQKAKKIY